MKVLILGSDGYLGRHLEVYLREEGCETYGIDDLSRRASVHEAGSESLFPLEGMPDLLWSLHVSIPEIPMKPDVIVHLAEQPSAPWSMRGSEEAVKTQTRNIAGTMFLLWEMRERWPEAHLIKLGTMGEYSDWIYENHSIPEESRLVVQFQGENFKIPTPRWAGSFYHWSKVFDSFNVEFACGLWGLKATDINQGIVYGTRSRSGELVSRFDYDDYFGTVVNRFIVQAVAGMPLTVYGRGGQTRGFINVKDVVKAISLVMSHPPGKGEFRIVNQLTEVKSIKEVAKAVSQVTGCDIHSIENPRAEREKHEYHPTHEKLKKWGLTDPILMVDEIRQMVQDVKKHKDRIREEVIMPRTRWNDGPE